ncbi:MAG: cell envelope integrity protein CreD [Prevotellaceae bacterium]|jgi:inner membrane protein|nr:cell envelope integrity protein CreD [Prevotellaceae bacterium]
MEAKRLERKFSQSLTQKALIIAGLALLLLIPSVLVQNLILERKNRSEETIRKINEKWSLSQRLCGPVLSIPFTTTYVNEKEKVREEHVVSLTPKNLNIRVRLIPEERHYGIYKTILYKSEIQLSGQLPDVSRLKIADKNNTIHFSRAYLSLGISDLRGLTDEVDFRLNGNACPAEVGGENYVSGKNMVVNLPDVLTEAPDKVYEFDCKLKLNGSSSMDFVPIGSATGVNVAGSWKTPGFTGSFSPDYQLSDTGFVASWSVLSINRSIPEYWVDEDEKITSLRLPSFGVTLVDTVDHYQQNMRSAKYAIMFIALTFVAFFFVEVLTKKRIHPVQYLLVGFALILFYSLLLSISEQLHFAAAYLIAAVATIALITTYASGIFKSKVQTGILALILSILYLFLYVILQLEDVALLIGSIGLFAILGIVMYFSQKIKWYRQGEDIE